MAPIRLGDGTKINPKGVLAVRKGDGQLIHSTLEPITDGLVANYDATELNLSDGDSVDNWPDEQANHDLSAVGSPVYRESGLNDNPAVEFNDDYFDAAEHTTYEQPNTIIVVAQLDGDPSQSYFAFGSDDSDNQNNIFWSDFYNGRWTLGSTDTTGTGNFDTQILTAVFDGSQSALRQFGDQTVEGDRGGVGGIGNIRVGSNADEGSRMQGHISEVLVFNRRLSTDEIESEELRLAVKYNSILSVGPFTDYETRNVRELTRNMETHEDYLFWTHHDRFYSIDVSSPESPVVLDSFDWPSADGDDPGALGLRITDDGSTCFIANGSQSFDGNPSQVHALDVSDPNNVGEIGVLQQSPELNGGHGIALSPDENVLYVTAYRGDRFTSVDVSDPSNMSVLDSVSLEEAHDVAIDSLSEYAYVSRYYRQDDSETPKFSTVSISDPSNMSVEASLDLTGFESRGAGARLTDDEDTFFMGAFSDESSGEGSLISIDVSDPTNPSIRDTSGSNRAYRLRLRDGLAFGAGQDENPGVTVWDVDDPNDVKDRFTVTDADTNGYMELEFHDKRPYIYAGGMGTGPLSIFKIQ